MTRKSRGSKRAVLIAGTALLMRLKARAAEQPTTPHNTTNSTHEEDR